MPNKPIKKFEIWPVRLSIWLNGDHDNPRPSFTIERRYKDKDDNYHSTNSFYLNNITDVAVLATQGLEWWLANEDDLRTFSAREPDDEAQTAAA